MMRVGLLAVSIPVVSACMLVIACGTQLAPPAEDAPDAGNDGAAAEPTELPLDDFACGPARCTVNVQVCCVANGGAICRDLALGCASPDGGAADGGDAAATPAPLACTTYRNCNGGNQQGSRDCCWSESQGSRCADDCREGELALCEGSDGCGYARHCESIPGDPLGPAIKRCVPDGSSTSSSGSSSGGPGGSSSW